MIAWPTLPAVDQSDYRETPADTTIRSEVDAGIPKVRRRFTAGIDVIDVTYNLTMAELATLDDFYRSTTKNGSLPFTYTHPRLGTTVVCRFKGAPQYSSFDYMAQAHVELEVLP
jgi:hypothetical protein